MKVVEGNEFFEEIKTLLDTARRKVVTTVNTTMITTYFEIGRRIVEEEGGDSNYGKAIISKLSDELTREFGKGFSETNLRQMKKFFLAYKKQQTVSVDFKLSWSHYITLMRIDNLEERG